MKNETFTSVVKRQFSFLETDYGFKVEVERTSDVRPLTDGVVKYKSANTWTIIDGETGHVAVRFVRSQDHEKYYLDPVSIHEYLTTDSREKSVLLSSEITDKDHANALFKQKYLLTSAGWKAGGEDTNAIVASLLANYAKWLRAHARICLTGDFSQWPDFYEYKINRLIADELRQGGKKDVLAVVKDEDGRLRTIKRPIFQQEKDHLAKLRKEILGS